MKYFYQFPKSFLLLVLALFFVRNSSAQTVNIPDAILKTKLLDYSPPIDTNSDGEIQVIEAAALTGMLDLSLDSSWESRYSDPMGLETFVNITGLNLANQLLTSFNISTFTNLQELRISGNNLSSIDVSSLVNLERLYLSHNELFSLDVSTLVNLQELEVGFNNLSSIDVSMLTDLEILYIDSNQLTSLNVSALANLQDLRAFYNNLSFIDVSNNLNLMSLGVGENNIEELDVSNNPNLVSFSFYYSPMLTHINMKNGNNINMNLLEGVLNTPNLEMICVDDVTFFFDNFYIEPTFDGVVTTYCSFNPAQFNTITGQLNLNMGEGCEASTALGIPNTLIRTQQGAHSFGTVTNLDGDYLQHLGEGTGTTSVINDLPSYFVTTPDSQNSSFTGYGNSVALDFCVEPTMAVEDLNITLFPSFCDPRPDHFSIYTISFENMGTDIVDGQINFEFDGTKQLFFCASTAITSYDSNSVIIDFVDLEPFESRHFGIKLYTKTPPDVNAGDILNFTATITPNDTDYTPNNNISQLSETVVNSFDPNDKMVLEGEEILINDADKYLHYLIRFQNTGTAPALNVVVTDTLSDLLDWNSLRMVSASHNYHVRITDDNFVEFIFENIDLPYEAVEDSASHGFVAYRIKPKSNVEVGDIIEGNAAIYFDLNEPIITNTVSTEIVENLSLENHGSLKEIRLFPNPTTGILNISNEEGIEKVEIFSLSGEQLIHQNGRLKTIDLGNLQHGIYFVKVTYEKGGKLVKKVIKK